MATAEAKRIARRYPEEVATERNLDLIDELLTEDYVEHGPFGRESHGRAEDRAGMDEILTAFPDFEATVEDVIAEGDMVAMRVTLRGTHEGEFMGIEPTGRSFEVQNMLFTRIEDGKIAERWVQPDTLGMFQQLGVVESPTA
ncbi:ester cyclase [Halobaculum marinum]|uniref:Ester cyclase n=1 Tax=Halobaculum marinum TaxID=3031996 RepID=A0ABD5WZ61_9EURY|nr:ester cyclase [Halobaculum sp. DT55]